MFFQYSLKIQHHCLTEYYYLCLTAQFRIYITSVVICALIGYFGDDIIICMAFVEIKFTCLCNV